MNTGYYGTDTTYGYNYGAIQAFGTGMLIFVGILWLIAIAVSIIQVISIWKIFKKAGKPGWASIIPIYNAIILFEIVGRKWWTLFLMMIPFYNIYLLIMINIELAKKFGKSNGFGIGLAIIPVIFYPILAFSKESVFEKEQMDAPDLENSLTLENTSTENNSVINVSNIGSQFTENNFGNVQEENNDINTQQDFTNEIIMNNGFAVPSDSMQNHFDNSKLNTYQNGMDTDTMNAVSEALNTIDTSNNQNENNVLFGADEFKPNPIQEKENMQQEYEQSIPQEQSVINEENDMKFNNDIYFNQPFVSGQTNDLSYQGTATNNEINLREPTYTTLDTQDSIQQAQDEALFSNAFNEWQNIETPVNEEVIDFETDTPVMDDANLKKDNDSNG